MQEEKKNEDPRLGDLMKAGIEGDIVLLGFPHDIGAKRIEKPFGQEYGPDCLRRFLPKSGPLYNPEYDIDISKLKITDYGNIECSETQTLEDLLAKLVRKTAKCCSHERVPFIIGGTKDIVYGGLKGLLNVERFQKLKIGVFSIQKFSDWNSFTQEGLVHEHCGVKKVLSEYPDSNIIIHYFGAEKYDHAPETNKFKEAYKNILSFTLLEDIKKTIVELGKNLYEPITPGGVKFLETLKSFAQNCDIIHLSISLEAMNSNDCPGVVHKHKHGFSSEEMLEILFQSGLEKRVISVDISDYCPGKEDFRTGILLSNLFYYFVMGYSKR